MGRFHESYSARASAAEREAVQPRMRNDKIGAAETGAVGDDRRAFARKPVNMGVVVHCRNRFQSARVLDYSCSGLNLDRTFGLFLHDIVEVEFVSGARVLGTVVWSVGQRAGIAFDTPLGADHQALKELSARELAEPPLSSSVRRRSAK